MCLPLLRIVVLAIVLALFPVKTHAQEAPFAATPVLVLSATQSRGADVRRAVSPRVTLSGLQPVETPLVSTGQFDHGQQFVRVFKRFVTSCSWLC